MTHIPPPGTKGVRRQLTVSEDEMVRMIGDAQATVRRITELDAERDEYRGRLAERCAQMHVSGLTLAQMARALKMSRLAVQRLVERGRHG